MLIQSVFDTEPDFVNEVGTKWWIHKNSTEYAKREDRNGIILDVTVWTIEEKNRYRSFLLTKDQTILFQSQQLESVGIHIDLLKFLKYDEESQNEKAYL